MFDTTLHAKTLERQFRTGDFEFERWGVQPEDKDRIIADALRHAAAGFPRLCLRMTKIGGKPVYRQSNLSEVLLLRHAGVGIKRVTSVRQSDRTAIVNSLKAIVREGTDYNFIKFDIKSFYESIRTQTILALLKADPAFSRQTVGIMEGYFHSLERIGIQGLPRGLGLSATLSEFLMRGFDSEIRRLKGVRYYNRFVDDGIIFLTPDADVDYIRSCMNNLLPSGLAYNRNKTKLFELTGFSKPNVGKIEESFSFLGYTIHINHVEKSNNQAHRPVRTDISHSKINKIKRKICIALHHYNQSGDFPLLVDRFKLITSNYGFIDDESGQLRYAGLRYNYGLIDVESSIGIHSLDRFVRNTLYSPHPNNRVRPNLNANQKRRLAGLSFMTGFRNNRFYNFEENRLSELLSCWVNA